MITIRKASRSDTETVFKIRNRAIMEKCSDHYSAQDLKKWTTGNPSEEFFDTVEESIYLAIINGEIAATGMIDIESGKIDAIFTDPDHMGKGAAKRMLEYLEQIASKAGLNEIRLESTLNAVSFYRMCGYVGDKIEIHESPGGVKLECVPMVKPISAAQ